MTLIAAHTEVEPARRPGRCARADRSASTKRYYDTHAAAYAAATRAIDVSERIDRFACLLPPGARVLDAGCGAGRDLIRFRDAGMEAVGVDVSPALVAIARRASACEVLVGDFAALPPMEPFDGVWAMASLLHHDRNVVLDALVSLSSMLRPGGVLFSSVKRGSGDAVDDTGRWFTLYGEDEWADLLRKAGLDVIDIEGEPPGGAGATGSVAPGWISALARLP